MTSLNISTLMNVMISDATRQGVIARNVPTEIQTNVEDMTKVLHIVANNNVSEQDIRVRGFVANRNKICYDYEPTLAVLPDVDLLIVEEPKLDTFKKLTSKMVAVPNMTAFANNNVVEKHVIEETPDTIPIIQYDQPADPSNIMYMDVWRPRLRAS